MVAVRAAGATKTTTVTAMAEGTNNNQLKAQLCPAHDGDKDDTPGMCLAVVVAAAMMVWEGGARWQLWRRRQRRQQKRWTMGGAGNAVQFILFFV